MKILIFFLPLFIQACTMDIVKAEKKELKDFSSSQIQKIKVKTLNGKIESSIWSKDTIHVTFEKWAMGDSKSNAEKRLDDIKVSTNMDTNSSEFSIDIDTPTHLKNYGCNIYINLPRPLSLNLASSNGEINVSQSESDIECSTSNGAITIQDTKGNAKLRTSNGKITVVNHEGGLSGETSNGIIDANVILPKQKECILITSNGGITLSVPNTTSAVIGASTSNGSINIENLDARVIKMEKNSFEGNIGKGEGVIKLNTSNGSILIKRKV